MSLRESQYARIVVFTKKNSSDGLGRFKYLGHQLIASAGFGLDKYLVLGGAYRTESKIPFLHLNSEFWR